MLSNPYPPPRTEKSRWPQFSLRRMLFVVAAVAMVVALVRYFRRPVELPQVREIARMQADVVLDGDMAKFDVPREYWNDVLMAMSSATYDHSPAKWESYGGLDLTKRDATRFHVSIFSTGDGLAVAAGETFEKRVYYRGGDRALLFRTLKDAYETAKAAKAASKPKSTTD